MRAMGFRHPKFFKGHLSCLHLQNERRISNKSLRHISGLLRRSWLNFCTRLTRTAPERLNLVRTIKINFGFRWLDADYGGLES